MTKTDNRAEDSLDELLDPYISEMEVGELTVTVHRLTSRTA